MVVAPPGPVAITPTYDRRITRVGRFLRKWKVDEIPQLVNVLKGDMSLVGPRPEVRHYTETFREDYEVILQVLPGMTDPASICFHNEGAILAKATDFELEYVRVILPEKIRMAKEYVRRRSLFGDLRIVSVTVFQILRSAFRG